MSKHQERFPVLSIDRKDVNHAIGYALGPELSDEQMRRIASKFSNALIGVALDWNILADIAESTVADASQDIITIEVKGGVVITVRGLPENYRYEILDHDVLEPMYPEYTKESE